MVQQPRQAVEGRIAFDPFENVKHTCDGFVVGGVQAEWPALFYQMTHHRLQVGLHPRGDTQSELILVGQFLDHLIVVRVVLIAAARINGAGHAQAVELAHELARGVDLILQRHFRSLGQGGVENQRIRSGDQHSGGLAASITLDLTAGRGWCVLVVANGAQCGAVEQGTVVKVQYKYWCIWCRLVQLL